jgi:hypothetical protein
MNDKAKVTEAHRGIARVCQYNWAEQGGAPTFAQLTQFIADAEARSRAEGREEMRKEAIGECIDMRLAYQGNSDLWHAADACVSRIRSLP